MMLNDSRLEELVGEIEGLLAEAFPDLAAEPSATLPGYAVLVRLGGETIYAGGLGRTRLDESGEALITGTDFRLASMTKQFTAAATLKLVERGKLRLDEKLTEIFPDFPEYGAAIEVRHLLGHTSGLPDYENLMPPDTTEQILDAGVLQIMREQTEGVFAPGAQYAYSNSGYAVLAMIVEARSGKRFAEFLLDEFFAPLGMSDTVAFEEGISTVPHRAFGHRRDDAGAWEFADQSTTSAVLGDGGVYTTVTDYAKWAEAWMAGRVLSPKLQERAWTPWTLNDGSTTIYGCGWRIEEIAGEKVVQHTGSTRGFNTAGYLVPSRGLVVVLLANRVGEEPATVVPKIVEAVLAAAQ